MKIRKNGFVVFSENSYEEEPYLDIKRFNFVEVGDKSYLMGDEIIGQEGNTPLYDSYRFVRQFNDNPLKILAVRVKNPKLLEKVALAHFEDDFDRPEVPERFDQDDKPWMNRELESVGL